MIDNDRVINSLIEDGDMTEVAHVTMFQGRRKNSKGEPQKITVKLLDLGSTKPSLRYYCEATSEEGKSATGNNTATIEEAISGVHWNQLD